MNHAEQQPLPSFHRQLRKELTWDRLLGMVLDAANGECPALVACKPLSPCGLQLPRQRVCLQR